jgi:glycosyltransferase involved in cell wall biosynthesis
VIAVSNDVADSIQKSIHPKIPVQIVLNGVNTRTFVRNAEDRITKRKELGLKENDIFIGVIAVFRFQKRLKEWIELFKAIHEKHPNVKGCIVGDGILKNEIMAHLKEMGMENHIIFPGLQANVKPWISAFDIFMMTSSFEGLPIALLESMSMECAVVSTDAGGIKEVIRPGVDGFTSPVAEWKQLESHLEYLINDKSALQKLSSQSRIRVQESFSLKKMVKETETAYYEILKK